MTTAKNKNTALAAACATLGLVPPFTLDKAKTRYRELAKLYHPDAGVIKDASRFAEISLAYDIVEKNIGALSKLQLTVASDINVEHNRATDLLKELHEARKQIINAEKKQKQLAEEARVLRLHYGQKHITSRGVLISGLILGIVAVFLGFLAGMFWSGVSPILPLDPGASLDSRMPMQEELPGAIQSADLRTTYPATIALNGEMLYSVQWDEGKVTLEGDTAQVKTTPTLTIKKWPAITVTSGTLPGII